MILELILSLILGLTVGVITGLIPGIHTNLVSAMVVSVLPFFSSFIDPLSLATFIISMSIANIFLDFIPSVFLGAPEEETAISVLPTHRLLLKGRAYEATSLLNLGAIIGTAILILAIPLTYFLITYSYNFIQKMMGFILVWTCILLIITTKNKFMALVISLLAGFLGFTTLNSQVTQPLLPIFTGLFGCSSLIDSISQKVEIPEQTLEKDKLKKKTLIKPIISSLLVSPLFAFLPGMGSSQPTIIGSKILGKQTTRQFLILNGTINFLIMALSFVILYLIQKARTGSAVAVQQVIQINLTNTRIFIVIIIISSIISYILAQKISKIFSNIINKINYQKTNKIILGFLVLTTLIISGPKGLLVLTISTSLGLFCQYLNIRKGVLMNVLLIPTIIFYLPF